MVKYRKFRDTLLEDLRDKIYAQTYLMVALEEYEKDNNINAFLEALRDVTEAQGGFTQLSQRTGLNRPHLYRALSPEGNPSLFNVNKILHGFGLRLAITSLAEPDISSQQQP